jgi:predicted  nucleic acid-binding Zn-ribbon protein
MRIAVAVICGLLVATSLQAQRKKREPLTPAQVDKIAETGIYPNARVELYIQYLNEHADAIKKLGDRARSDARANKLNYELEDFTALQDELGDNLDALTDRKADIRKSLQKLTEATPRWQGILRALMGEAGFDLARKEAIESGLDLASQAQRLLQEQEEYFKQHPDEVGQDRWEPK